MTRSEGRKPSGQSNLDRTPRANGETRLRLSTRATPFVRIIPLVVLAASASGVVAAASQGEVLVAVLVALGTAGLAVLFVFLFAALWDVWLDDTRLIVSRFMQRKEIPLSEIKQVSLHRLGDDHRIRITLNDFSSYGRRLVFMPTGFKQRSGRPQEIVALLRERAGLDEPGRNK